MHFGPNGRQVHIAETIFTIIPYPLCLSKIFSNHCTSETIVRIIMYFYSLVNIFYRNNCDMWTKYLLSEYSALWIVLHTIHEWGHKITLFILITCEPSSI